MSESDWRYMYPSILARIEPVFVKVIRDVLSDGDLQAIADCSPDPDSFIVRVGHAVAVRMKRRSITGT